MKRRNSSCGRTCLKAGQDEMTPAISMAGLCFEMKGRLLWAVSSNRFCVEVSAMPWQLETALSTLRVIVFKVFGVLQ